MNYEKEPNTEEESCQELDEADLEMISGGLAATQDPNKNTSDFLVPPVLLPSA